MLKEISKLLEGPSKVQYSRFLVYRRGMRGPADDLSLAPVVVLVVLVVALIVVVVASHYYY